MYICETFSPDLGFRGKPSSWCRHTFDETGPLFTEIPRHPLPARLVTTPDPGRFRPENSHSGLGRVNVVTSTHSQAPL